MPAGSSASEGGWITAPTWVNGPMPVGPRPEEITALGEAGLAGDALLASLTGPPGDRLRATAAVYAPLPLPMRLPSLRSG